MTEMAIQQTLVLPAEAGKLRVQIVVSDTVDTDNARESISLAVVLERPENPTLAELQLSAMRRTQTLLADRIKAMGPSNSAR